MIEETARQASSTLLSYGLAGVFSLSFLALVAWLVKFGLSEVKGGFERIHDRLEHLSESVTRLEVTTAKLEVEVTNIYHLVSEEK